MPDAFWTSSVQAMRYAFAASIIYERMRTLDYFHDGRNDAHNFQHSVTLIEVFHQEGHFRVIGRPMQHFASLALEFLHFGYENLLIRAEAALI
jgi:hypothetical protein